MLIPYVDNMPIRGLSFDTIHVDEKEIEVKPVEVNNDPSYIPTSNGYGFMPRPDQDAICKQVTPPAVEGVGLNKIISIIADVEYAKWLIKDEPLTDEKSEKESNITVNGAKKIQSLLTAHANEAVRRERERVIRIVNSHPINQLFHERILNEIAKTGGK